LAASVIDRKIRCDDGQTSGSIGSNFIEQLYRADIIPRLFAVEMVSAGRARRSHNNERCELKLTSKPAI
jgi:hypothetical protein